MGINKQNQIFFEHLNLNFILILDAVSFLFNQFTEKLNFRKKSNRLLTRELEKSEIII